MEPAARRGERHGPWPWVPGTRTGRDRVGWDRTGQDGTEWDGMSSLPRRAALLCHEQSAGHTGTVPVQHQDPLWSRAWL